MSVNNNNPKEKFENIEKIKSKPKEEEDNDKKLLFWRMIINIVLSIFLIVVFFIMWTSYTTWKLFFFITVWSFWSNTFYIISITVVDICQYKGKYKCEKLNSWVRNYFIRIIFPFSLGTVIIFWELVLLGENFIDIDYTLEELVQSFFINGLVLIFVFFDIFTAPHLNKNKNYKKDLLIISIIVALHFFIVIICKEFLNIYQWNFLTIADFRQIIGSFIIIYLIILNGYIILYLISDNFFLKEEIDEKEKDINNNEDYNKKNKNESNGNERGINDQEKVEQKNEIEFSCIEEENNDEEKIDKKNENKEDLKDNKNEEEDKIEEVVAENGGDKNNIEKEGKEEDNNIEIIIKKNKDKFVNRKKLHIIIPKNNENEEK